MNLHHHHSFKKMSKTPYQGLHPSWQAMWAARAMTLLLNHSLCVHQAALRTRVTPPLRGGGISPAALPPANLPSGYSPRSVGPGSLSLSSFYLHTHSDLILRSSFQTWVCQCDLRHSSLRWWVCFLRSPTPRNRQRRGGLKRMAAPLEPFMMGLVFISTKLGLHSWGL